MSQWNDLTIIVFQASKTKVGSVNKPPSLTSSTTSSQVNKSGYPSGVSTVNQLLPLRSSSTLKLAGPFSAALPRGTAPRLVAAGNTRGENIQISTDSTYKITMHYYHQQH